MHFVIKIFPEIVIKSPAVRKMQSKMLQENIVRCLKGLAGDIVVSRDWEKLELSCEQDSPELHAQIVKLLRSTPGIIKFSETEVQNYDSLDNLCAIAVARYQDELAGKSFGVRVKRSGQQSFNSMDVERAVGSALMLQTGASKVDLTNPDVWVELEVRKDRLFLLGQTWPGLGGFPVGSQGKVLSLISGGFDSSVSSFQAIRRGMLVHFLFFNIGGRAHEIAVRQMTYHLWSNYGRSHNSRFISVPFEQVVAEIARKASPSYGTVLLKRMMMRCASELAATYEIDALSTGESVGQVSSQTLANLRLIDEAADCLVMRPLINMDKGDIIDIARSIGTAEMAEANPEYCGRRSDRPTTNARRDRLEKYESELDANLISQALANAKQMPVSRVIDDIATLPVDIYSEPPPHSVILDVRHPDEVSDNELKLEGNRVIAMPFFEIQKRYGDQPQDLNYLLYCERGIMSRLHAELLLEAGFQNVAVYRP